MLASNAAGAFTCSSCSRELGGVGPSQLEDPRGSLLGVPFMPGTPSLSPELLPESSSPHHRPPPPSPAHLPGAVARAAPTPGLGPQGLLSVTHKWGHGHDQL